MTRASIRVWRGAAVVMAIAGATALWCGPSRADGALAVGIAPGGAAAGFAGGHAVNEPDAESARKQAVASCQKSTGAAKSAQQACSVVAVFRNQCYAIAIDPKDGTPGAGWAIDDTQELADNEALAQCRATSADDRKSACVVPSTNHVCDGDAK
jgi:hypothetical protein